MKRSETGKLGEKLAKDFLKKKGYHLIESNFRCREGEIDIVTRHKDSLVFIEVRSKTGTKFGIPEESITPAKMRKLRTVGAYYRQTHENLPEFWRIDIVAVELDFGGKVNRIELLENAVGGD